MLSIAKELLKYRALVRALVVRHLAIRYRGSVLGFLWSFLNPLCLMAVYALVFKYYIRFDQVEHYTVFLFVGLLPWLWTSSALLEGTSAIAAGGHLITKSMFPAHILPAVSVVTTMVNFLLSLPILFLFMVVSGVPFHLTLLALPLAVLVQLMMLYGMTLALAAVNVQFRDVQHLLGNMLTLIFFLCPIIYPVQSVPERFRFTLELNPFALLVTSYQHLILDGSFPPAGALLSMAGFTLVALLAGVLVYRKYQDNFAELL